MTASVEDPNARQTRASRRARHPAMAIDTASTPSSPSTSRRAVLAAAAGAAAAFAAFAAGAVARPSAVQAADGDAVTAGQLVTSEHPTAILNSTNGFSVFRAESQSSGTGVQGVSDSGLGVLGDSNSNAGVKGISQSSVGVDGVNYAADQPACLGWARGNGNGVQGHSGNAAPPAAAFKTGVFGYSAVDSQAVGVLGESPHGFGVYGKTDTGFAGYFSGKTFMSRYLEMAVMAAPPTPQAARGRIFIRDNAGKLQLCVRFPNGTVRLLASE